MKEAKTVTLQINPFKKTGSDTGGFGENVHRMARIDAETGAVRGALDIIQPSIQPLLKKVKWLEPSTPIYAEDLQAWEKFAGIRIGAGDALLIRTGRWAKRAAEGPWAYGEGGAGLHASVLPWLRARDVSLLGSDAVNDVQPSGVTGINRPIHQLTQVNMDLRDGAVPRVTARHQRDR